MRRPKPYYKKSHRAWYVNLNGKTTRPASEEAAAYAKYDKLMANGQPLCHKCQQPVIIITSSLIQESVPLLGPFVFF